MTDVTTTKESMTGRQTLIDLLAMSDENATEIAKKSLWNIIMLIIEWFISLMKFYQV